MGPSGCEVDYRKQYDTIYEDSFREECETTYVQVCRCDKKVEYVDVEECGEDYVDACPEKWEIIDGAKVWVPDSSKCVSLKQTKMLVAYMKCGNKGYQRMT